MKKLTNEEVEEKIIEVVATLCKDLVVDITIDGDICPGNIPYMTSHILVTVMGRVESLLDVKIPDNVYIFYDKKNNKQLSVKEAADKLLKTAKYGE